MMCPMTGGSSTAVLLLLSLAAGYGVLVLSKTQPRPLDGLGRFVGGLILLVSFTGLLAMAACGVWCAIARCQTPTMCAYSPKAPVDAPAESIPAAAPAQ